MIRELTILFLWAVPLVNLGQPPLRYKFSDGWGYVDRQGRTVIPPRFILADHFSEGLAVVQYPDSTYGFITLDGRDTFAARYESASSFSGGVAAVGVKGRYGVINQNGLMVARPIYQDISPSKNGMVSAMLDSTRYVLMNQEGKVIFTHHEYIYANFNEAGLQRFKTNTNLYGWFDREGRVTISPRSDSIGPVYHEGLKAFGSNGAFGYRDTAGHTVIPPIFSEAYQFAGGLAVVAQKGRFGLINHKGQFTVRPIYGLANGKGRGDAWIMMDSTGKWGCIDRMGRVVLPFIDGFLQWAGGKSLLIRSNYKPDGTYSSDLIDLNGNRLGPPVGVENLQEVDFGSSTYWYSYRGDKVGIWKLGEGFIIPMDYDRLKRYGDVVEAYITSGKWNPYMLLPTPPDLEMGIFIIGKGWIKTID
jgi:WG containing repeat